MTPIQLPREVLHKILGFAIDGEVVKVHKTGTAARYEDTDDDDISDSDISDNDIPNYIPADYTGVRLAYDDTVQALLDVEEVKEDAQLMAYKHVTLDITEFDLKDLPRFQGLFKEHVHHFRNVRAKLLGFSGRPDYSLEKLFHEVESLALFSDYRSHPGSADEEYTLKDHIYSSRMARAMKLMFSLTEGAIVTIAVEGRRLDKALGKELYTACTIEPDEKADEKAVAWAKG
jgi:hypothetical protein